MTELALISFDGLDPRVIYNNIDTLPNFRKLTENSQHGKWQTPGHTIPSFTATLTGRQYNEYDFHWDDGEGGHARHRQFDADYLWDVCDSSMTLLNMPTCYPPEEIDDAMVCGFLTPNQSALDSLARPMRVQDKLNDMGYTPDIEARKIRKKLGVVDGLEHIEDVMRKRADVAEWLIDTYDSDLFYGVWTSPDRWFHEAWKEDLNFMPLYRMADSVLGRMMEYLPDDIPKVVFSDHGFAHFDGDEGVHKGHMFEGFYAVDAPDVPNHRSDSANIMDLFPTVVNYLEGEAPQGVKGRVLFHTEEQTSSVEDRLNDLGYLE